MRDRQELRHSPDVASWFAAALGANQWESSMKGYVDDIEKVTKRNESFRRVLYTGRVQGVGFRYTTRRIAHRYPITGYVKNLPDGRVELLAEGAPADLDQFLADIAATMSDHIHHTETQTLPASHQHTAFEISM